MGVPVVVIVVVCIGEWGVVGVTDAFECDGDACIRDNESMCRTFDVSDSRLVFGTGEFLAGLARVGDAFGVDTGIDELFRFPLFRDISLRRLCAESGRYRFGDVDAIGVFCMEFDIS